MPNRETATQLALDYGFDLVGFAPAGAVPGAQAFLDWLGAGYAGEMHYLARDLSKRFDPRVVLPGARTVMIVGISYDTQAVPMETLRDQSRGRIARYAWGHDYHDVITSRLRTLGDHLSKLSRTYVDTGPVLERAWAVQCGLGFIGRNTCLIHRTHGSYFFLGAVLLEEEIGDSGPVNEEVSVVTLMSNPQFPPSRKAKCGCGQCTRCLTACPTQAFAAPSVLDARRCISYLTIELKGSIPVELRPLMGNWIFGCDICQDVCPYVRRYSLPARERLFYPTSIDRAAPHLLDVLGLDRSGFNLRYKGTPLVRAKRRGLLRNACVAAGNWGSLDALPALQNLLSDVEPLIREHAAWAIARIKENE